MESSQAVINPAAAGPSGAVSLDPSGRVQDEDVVLGFECADPALQIERWGLEHALQSGSN
jgi:hypothetical protein